MNTKSSVIIYDKTNTDVFLEATCNDLSFDRIYDTISYYDCKNYPDSDKPSHIRGRCIHGEESKTLAYVLYVLLDRYKDIMGNNISVNVDIDYIEEDDLYIILLQRNYNILQEE